ncbi:unnamed protein product [Pleuronectes platessa]|uniref:Uncharacterized protein n=1 Tax=Pleuronectes platessa TaxID=8262 RepID=A0A9N7YUN9_PLEPL|nr:unnamed protein product [Pleuronectes platessa]
MSAVSPSVYVSTRKQEGQEGQERQERQEGGTAGGRGAVTLTDRAEAGALDLPVQQVDRKPLVSRKRNFGGGVHGGGGGGGGTEALAAPPVWYAA